MLVVFHFLSFSCHREDIKSAKRYQTLKSKMLQERRTEQERGREGRREGVRRAQQTRNELPSGALYPVLSHSVISAVSLIFSDRDKIKVAYLLLLPPLRAVTQENSGFPTIKATPIG